MTQANRPRKKKVTEASALNDITIDDMKDAPATGKTADQLEVGDAVEMMGDAVEMTIDLLNSHRSAPMVDICTAIAEKYHTNVKSVTARLVRTVDAMEYRSGVYPNPEMEELRIAFRLDKWTLKRFLYAAARRLMGQ